MTYNSYVGAVTTCNNVRKSKYYKSTKHRQTHHIRSKSLEENYHLRIFKMFKTGVVYFAVLAVFLKSALAVTDEQKIEIQTKILAVGAECIKEFPLSIDDLSAFKSKVFPEGENASCFTACIFNKLGLFDDKGTWSHVTALENAKKLFEDEDLKNIEGFLTTCAKVNEEEVADGEKGCDRAKLAYDCFIKNYEQLGFDFDF